MPKGKPKGGHKGRMRRFVTEEEIADQEEKKKREQEWKKKKGLSSNIDKDKDSEEEDDAITAKVKSEGDDDVSFSRGASGGRGLEEEEESSEEEDSSDDEYNPKSKGVEGLIEIENPNRVQQKGRKVQNLDVNAKVELSRREREEIQKQKDATNYRKKHEAGQTDEARRDLARLALIRQQREEVAKKRDTAKKVEASKK